MAKNANPFLERVISNFHSQPDSTFSFFKLADDLIEISWKTLEESTRRYLFFYNLSGISKGGIVLIFSRHYPHMYSSYLAAMLGGYVPSYMPCLTAKQNPKLFWDSHITLLTKIKPEAVLADRDTLAEMRQNGFWSPDCKWLSFEDAEKCASNDMGDLHILPSSATALLQHSSGTTGLKKGVALDYDSIWRQISYYSKSIDLNNRDIIATWLPLYHDMGLMACFILPLALGVPIIHLDSMAWVSRPGEILALISKYHATLMWLPNFAYEHLSAVAGREASKYSLDSLRAIINCSEVCRPQTFDRFHKAFANSGLSKTTLQCCYAMAETVFAVTQTDLKTQPKRLSIRRIDHHAHGQKVEVCALGGDSCEVVEVGKPISPTVEVSICDEKGSALPELTIGEITIRSDYLFAGYYKQPELSRERVRSETYFTQDMGFVHEGALYILGRLDDLIIINGRNIYAHEVEGLLLDIKGLKPGRNIALSMTDERLGTQYLVIIAERDSTNSDSNISQAVQENIFSVLQIKARNIYLVGPGWLIKSTSGKISRSANQKKWQDEIA